MDTANTVQRLLSEFETLRKSENDDYVWVKLVNSDIYHWMGLLSGPESTPYEGGYFLFHIEFPENYPAAPPDFYFLTPIFHPNIRSDNGRVCCQVFTTEFWKPSITARAIFSYIISLLNEPRPQAGYIGEATELCETDIVAFDLKAKEYTEKYANLEYIQGANREQKEAASNVEIQV